MIVNLHVSLTPFVNESRLLKESTSLLDAGVVDRVYITALKSEGLEEHQVLDERRSVWRIPLRTRSWPSILLVQVLKYMEYAFRVLAHARAVRASIVTIHSLSLLPLGVLSKWVLGARLVYDCHELETETFGLSGMRQSLARFVERRLIGQADLVLVVSPGISDWYIRTYGIDTVYTVMNCPPKRMAACTGRLRETLGIPAERKIVIYQGGIIPGRGIEDLLAAFAAHDDGVHALVLMGYGELTAQAEAFAAAHANIFVQQAVAPEVVLEYTASADVGVSYIDNPSLNDRYCLPNKLFEYIMAGLPVLVNDAPDMKRVVEEHGIGVVLTELSPTSVASALAELAQRSRADLETSLANTAREYCWENQATILLDAHRRRVIPKLSGAAQARSMPSVTR
jgi:glycosyltransferase involved in cell wall biosynthesis